MTTLMHYTAEPLVFDRTRQYEQREPYTYCKPEGFWVSVPGEDDWPSWCNGEEFCLDSLAFAHRVTLNPDANILRIEDGEGLVRFHVKHRVETDYERRNSDLYKRKHWPINWPDVAKRYDGLIIAPYQGWLRFDALWYYGWDCASGCIWNLDAIESVDAEVSA